MKYVRCFYCGLPVQTPDLEGKSVEIPANHQAREQADGFAILSEENLCFGCQLGGSVEEVELDDQGRIPWPIENE